MYGVCNWVAGCLLPVMFLQGFIEIGGSEMQSGSNARLLHLVLICAFMIYGCAWTQGEQKKEPPSPHPGYVMRFERMGGYLGVQDQFFIYPDGRIIGDSRKTARVGPATVADWIKNISPAATKEEKTPCPGLCGIHPLHRGPGPGRRAQGGSRVHRAFTSLRNRARTRSGIL